MVTAVQALLHKKESRPKAFNKDKIKERSWSKVTKPEPTKFIKVLVKAEIGRAHV